MKRLRILLAAAVVALPALMITEPAAALTAKQYKAQGHGRYITSKGRHMGYPGPYRHQRFYRHHRYYR